MNKLGSAVLVLALLTTFVSVGTAAAAPEWRPCEVNPAVECAELAVPVDWATPDGSSLDLALVRHNADPARRIGVLVYAPAGPGSSGVDTIADDTFLRMMFTPEVLARFDIVSFDPRGVRRSTPVTCDSELAAQVKTPDDAGEFTEQVRLNRALSRDCRDRTGPVYDHLDSVAQAQDLDAIRAALGERTINMYALSYGTVLGQMYAERFPQRIRTMVLDANVDHSVGTAQGLLTSAVASEEAFDGFADWCGTHTECVLHGWNVRAIVADLRAKASRGELTDPADGTVIEHGDLVYRIISPMTQPNLPESAKRIAALARLEPASRVATEPTVPLPIYISCADFKHDLDTYATFQSTRAKAAALAPDIGGAAYSMPAQLCIRWTGQTTNPVHKLDVRGAPPILVANSRIDPSTPLAGAQRVAGQIPGAVLLTYEGWGHGAYPRSDCTKAAVDNYLMSGLAPLGNVTCPAVEP